MRRTWVGASDVLAFEGGAQVAARDCICCGEVLAALQTATCSMLELKLLVTGRT